MAAIKLIFKRSSVFGKRPTGANLTAGEIALNTNSNDSGLFFEVAVGSIVKAHGQIQAHAAAHIKINLRSSYSISERERSIPLQSSAC
jgi:hypothetical protein